MDFNDAASGLRQTNERHVAHQVDYFQPGIPNDTMTHASSAALFSFYDLQSHCHEMHWESTIQTASKCSTIEWLQIADPPKIIETNFNHGFKPGIYL